MSKRKFFIWMALCLSPCVGQSDNLKINFSVEKFVLGNGLTVLLHEDHSIPMISYHTWYRVGSRDEHPGVTGAAHMLEHMMFKGAKKYTGAQFDEILHSNGITNNAFTSYDYTGFYESLPSSKLELIMDLEVDRMENLALKAEDLTSELQVVGEERRWRVDNSPPSFLQELMMGTLFQVHPYRWPVIGYMKDIQAYTVEKLRPFYETFYVPNNAVLVIAGDIDLGKTKQLVRKHYGGLKSKKLPKRQYPVESAHEGRIETTGEVQSTTLLVSYKGVAVGAPDGYALDLLANILASGTSSRLHKKLVYQNQKATSVSSYNLTLADPGYFSVSASMIPGEKAIVAEQILDLEIKHLQKTLVSELELSKAKNHIMKEFVDNLQTIHEKAEMLAVNEIVRNDYRWTFKDLALYQAVTSVDIQKVAQKYLKPQRRVTSVLNPIGKK